MRVITWTWGLAYMLEAVLGFAIAFLAPVRIAIAAEPAIGIATALSRIAWTAAYARARQCARENASGT